MESKILELLAEICEDESVMEDPEMDLFEADLLDSIGFAELLVEIEEEFGAVIAPSEIEREEINTPGKIINVIMERLG